MRKMRLSLGILAVLLVSAALPHKSAAQSVCFCETLCWGQGDQQCWQDECCHRFCCDLAVDPGCSPPC